MLQALLYHIRRELLLSQQKQRPQQLLAYLLIYLQRLQLQHVLNHVVAKRVPHEYLRVLSYHRDQVPLLPGAASVNALLHDTAAVFVTGYLHALLHHGIVDELRVLFLPRLQDLLNHVVAVDVLCQRSHLVLQVTNQQLDLLRLLDYLDDLLDAPGAVGVSAEPHWVLLHSLDDLSELLLAARLGYLLRQVVAEGVVHQVHAAVNHAHEDPVPHFILLLIDLLLQEPAASLVSR